MLHVSFKLSLLGMRDPPDLQKFGAHAVLGQPCDQRAPCDVTRPPAPAADAPDAGQNTELIAPRAVAGLPGARYRSMHLIAELVASPNRDTVAWSDMPRSVTAAITRSRNTALRSRSAFWRGQHLDDFSIQANPRSIQVDPIPRECAAAGAMPEERPASGPPCHHRAVVFVRSGCPQHHDGMERARSENIERPDDQDRSITRSVRVSGPCHCRTRCRADTDP